MDALIFDFDGVVVDSEPLHLKCFQKLLAGRGVELTREAYYSKYLGFDDHDVFTAVMRDSGAACNEQEIAQLIAAKTELIKKVFAESVDPLPGAVELIAGAATNGTPVAVCSGALRDEITLAAKAIGVQEHFIAIVSAEDVRRGKPDPEGFRLALERLRAACRRELAVRQCVVVEDSPAGIEAAKSAGMKVLAVTNSYPAEALQAADRVVDSLADVSVASLEELLEADSWARSEAQGHKGISA